jgi:probable HAF family extracellular repeat protein
MKAGGLRAVLGLGGLAVPIVVVVGVVPSARAEHRDATAEYVITELGMLGGASGAGASSINNRGWVAGFSTVTLPDGGAMHATLWRAGVPTDLDTLGGRNSAVLWPVKSNGGIVVGVAETADRDPRDEAWSCSVFFGVDTDRACVGFVWEQGEMRALDTLGGTHGFATGANNRGQVVGWAERAEVDPSCNQTDQFLGFHAAVWDTRRGDRVRGLPPLPDDSASSATAINDRGQVVGISGDCADAVGGFTARHAVLWQDGVPRDIGDLGGEAWNTPMAINNDGVVVGFANSPDAEGDAFDYRAFIWTEQGGVRPLGALGPDTRSQALGINDDGQIVGLSRGAAGSRAVIWRDGVIRDLKALAPGYNGRLLFANDINDDGVITGQALSAATGQTVAFIATPTEE